MKNLLLTILVIISIIILQSIDINSLSIPIKNEPPYPVVRGTQISKNSNLICINGLKSGTKCLCKPGYSGESCQNKMFCQNFNLTRDGLCESCMDNYEGDFCDTPICKHGKTNVGDQKCICDSPYSGEFCDKINKADVLLYHNQKMRMFGPIGFLALIPMALFYYCCERGSKKRKLQRYAKILEGEQFDVCPKAVKTILDEK
ncbi:Epidermal growth factor-like domain-containing protein [Strongyloides ratti]|uniref:Epidermal growth factor-like domain-containing protein n=1 Tax=Strongyloides ratti TaxID=34506 RepID=A0A090L783_STRRB|nr:Epidermal growth factor-like domain-containing protein [Strongyloides ratti]CEF63364.1 Epidermal growth factor-like domain-containing protein [Strongyloides ratti]